MSSRLGKINHPKSKVTVYVAVDEDGRGCGHQHASFARARNCAIAKGITDARKGQPATAIKAYMPTGDREKGRIEVPNA